MMPAKYDKKGPKHMVVLTLVGGGKVYMSPNHVVAFHKSLDVAKSNVTVVYTQWNQFPFEVMEEPMMIGNWVAMAKRGQTTDDNK